ncbi:MAG: response regulator transcription factor [Alphaproteobacteria bacterium]|nr:response regulator transcription factor [Alphaproteobacteria bacterium]
MNKNILIIDDDDMLRNSLAQGLRASGFNVIGAFSAENANAILSKISVDAIVLDRMMTGMDGLTFLKQLRKSGNNTPTIMLTALSGTENTIEGLANGADDYLAKPFQIRELILRINNITRHIQHITPTLPTGLFFIDDEFFIDNNGIKTLFALSGEEKKLLQGLVNPIGNTVVASPMVAKRLRNKLNIVLSDIDIITIRGQGYRLIESTCTPNNKNGE